ncbi:MAG: AAA family ATPase [Nocardioidaceae bacterium]
MPESSRFKDGRIVRRVVPDPPDEPLPPWLSTVPAVAQLLADGLDLDPGVTFLVGENASGKSTIVEAVAAAFGLSPEGGSTQAVHSTRISESPLAGAIRLERSPGATRWGFFLRAESMHGYYTFLEQHPAKPKVREPRFHEMSHGESFLTLLTSRLDSTGFYCLDEPEAALSFSSTLAFVGALADLASSGSQILCSTHSPILASLPSAKILEVGQWGLREARWDELELVRNWKAYLDAPQRYLRHVLGDDA